MYEIQSSSLATQNTNTCSYRNHGTHDFNLEISSAFYHNEKKLRYAIPLIMGYIQGKCKGKGDIRDQFHLFTGTTSVGGMGPLLLAKNKIL